MPKITPHLWFDNNAEEAMNFYTSVFPNSKVLSIERYPDTAFIKEMEGMQGKVLNGQFELDGFQLQCLDGGPIFTFNPSVSFLLNFDPSRDSQATDRLQQMWDKLIDGGHVLMELGRYPFCQKYGWLKDKFGVSWQLILSNPEGEERPFIVPALMFIGNNNGKAIEAMNYYVSMFPDSKTGLVSSYPDGAAPDSDSKVSYEDFMLANRWFAAMDSGRQHDFNFNEAISFIVDCQDQAEVDHYWQMSAVTASEQCGWLKDKFGVSWQIIPKQLGELLASSDKEVRDRVMQAMLQMKKIDVAELEKAAQG
jgi:predicted 3-demethylubiquinone-9 3-methyltransferase (glyoxalase superfamily)